MRRSPSHPSLLQFALLAGCVVAYTGRLHAQDSTMMKHDSAMMPHETGMMKKDEMTDHKPMAHEAMEPNMMFMAAGGHKAAGDYEIVNANGKQQIKLTDDFAVDSAPDTYLVLATGDQPDAQSVFVAKLKTATGGQTYDLPKGTDLSKYTKLIVWSKKTHSLLASADLAESGHMMRK
jgi:Electron transfer DM13